VKPSFDHRARAAQLLAGAALLFVPADVWAQDRGRAADPNTTVEQQPGTQENADGVLGDQGDEVGFGTILVTAQKRTQALQDVSIPVSALDANRITDAQALSLEDVQQITPSLSVGNNGGIAKIFMRGIGLSEQTAGVDPSVAVHVDGAVVNNPIAHFTSVFDLSRIEVLRGPQGTLYGRNATGGAINMVTNKPTRDFEGYARGTYGNYDAVVAEFAGSGPIVEDRLLGRAAFRVNTHSGYGINEVTGNDIDDARQMSARGQLQFLINDAADVLISGEWYREDDANRSLKYKQPTFDYLNSSNPAALRPFGLGGFATGDPRNVASEVDPQNRIETWAVTGIANWELSDVFTLTNIANYRELDSTRAEDFDVSSVVNRFDLTGLPASIHYQEFTSEQFSNELQLNFATDSVFGLGRGLEGLVAAYYFTEDSFEDNRTGASPNPVPAEEASLLTQRVVLLGTGHAESWAVFANATFYVTDQIGLKLGGRYTHESREIENSSLVVLANNARVRRALTDERSFSDFTPEVGIEWKPTEDLLLYYTYSEGFKTGAGLLGNLDQGISDPETITNHEFGIKSSFFNDRLIANLAAFSYRLSDLQVGRTVPTNASGTGFAQRFENATSLKGEGFELELRARPVPELRLEAGVAYLDARFGEFTSINQLDPEIILGPIAVPPRAPPLINLEGNRPRQSPKWSYTLHADADLLNFDNGGQVVVAGDLSYKGEQFYSEFNAPVFRQGAYTLVDASLTYRAPDDVWSLSLWGKNLADKLISSGAFAVSLTRTVGQTFLPPRTYGLTLGVNF